MTLQEIKSKIVEYHAKIEEVKIARNEAVLKQRFEESAALREAFYILINECIELHKELTRLNSTTSYVDGGIVTGPTSGLVGEAGPMVIMPLNKFMPLPTDKKENIKDNPNKNAFRI